MPRPRQPRPVALAAGLIALACALATAAPAAALTPAEAGAASRLGAVMRLAGPWSSAHVVNATTGETVFSRRAHTARVLASNTKLFTTAAALARFGAGGRIPTEVLAAGTLAEDGTYRGDLYLRGGGDPVFGSRRFGRRAYGGGTSVEALAQKVEQAGITRVSGRVLGDESRFDSLRGGPGSGWRSSIWLEPLSALAFNRGLARARRPSVYAAARLDAALERRGIRVARAPWTRRAPAAARRLAAVHSPPMARLIRLTNKPSDNYLAEMLLKGLALRETGFGTTRAGARLSAAFARRLGAPVSLVDGSGLSRADRATPARLARFLVALRRQPDFPSLYASLPIAGRDGTLARRMRWGPARGRCRAKSGSLRGVSALSGFCTARSGGQYAFSFLMNGVSPYAARPLQDRMAHALAAVGG